MIPNGTSRTIGNWVISCNITENYVMRRTFKCLSDGSDYEVAEGIRLGCHARTAWDDSYTETRVWRPYVKGCPMLGSRTPNRLASNGQTWTVSANKATVKICCHYQEYYNCSGQEYAFNGGVKAELCTFYPTGRFTHSLTVPLNCYKEFAGQLYFCCPKTLFDDRSAYPGSMRDSVLNRTHLESLILRNCRRNPVTTTAAP